MMDALRWIEQTQVSRFVREDFSAYFILLIAHAWGMALLVGGGMAVCLRVLGIAAGTRLAAFASFFPVMKLGAVLAILSGLGLLAGYPAKALTNPVFGVKLACLIVAGLIMAWIGRRLLTTVVDGAPIPAGAGALPAGAKALALFALILWFAGVACGKLLLYTNTMLLLS
jgi:hypothetical protein